MSTRERTDWREMNIQNRMGRCVHFTGAMNKTCAAGVEYEVVTIRHAPLPYRSMLGTEYTTGASSPCIDRYNVAGAVCEQRKTMTRAEAEADEARSHQDVINMGIARKAIMAHHASTGENRGAIPCPVCTSGTLGYRRATSNGHVAAKCSTGGCVAWME